MNASNAITAEAIIPVGPQDVGGIPEIAFAIPDFEGYATLRFYGNSTKTEIGCFQARMKNGVTLSHPGSIGGVIGFFTVIAMLASFATAIYGVSIPAMRTHYAHALPMLVIFETFQSFFFSGALSVDWPSVCAAWWSNWAWAAGMIHTESMVSSINNFIGENQGNSSQVGGAGSSPISTSGGLRIYGRSRSSLTRRANEASNMGASMAGKIFARDASAASGSTGTEYGLGYSWYGSPAKSGLPSPGSWYGFGGTLSEMNIPASDAFMTGFLWLLVLLAGIIVSTIAFKWLLEGLAKIKWIQHDRLALFRSHWLGFLGVIVLRTLMIAFFMMLTLTLYQFSLGGAAGVLAIAAIVFIIFFVGMLGVAGYACFYRLRFGHYESHPDRLIFIKGKAVRQSSLQDDEKSAHANAAGFPIFGIKHINDTPEMAGPHEDETFIKKFGWLTAHYRKSRWWFFAVWLVYQFVRACFVGGASKSPQAQVFGLFVIEIIAAIMIIILNPFEGSRNTALAVYLLSISKVITAGMSIAFLPSFKLQRIPTTVVGFVIIITQGLVAIAVLILIVLGVISSYMSLRRNREEFSPRSWNGVRIKYYEHIQQKSTDVPPPPKPKKKDIVPEEPKGPYFEVKEVKRMPRIEDEDVDVVKRLPTIEDEDVNVVTDIEAPAQLPGSRRHSRSGSMNSRYSTAGNLPFGARVHRASWSSRDFANWQQESGMVQDGTPGGRSSRMSGGVGAVNSFSPLRSEAGPSRQYSHSRHSSMNQNPGAIFHPPTSLSQVDRPRSGSLVRSGTPSREQLEKHREERIGAASVAE
jgi:hypothetical protein